ncbi:MAG: DNA replication protein DnaC [Glaciecola sp.]|jgi:DNA replication protein DnaC
MKSLNDRITELAKSLGKDPEPEAQFNYKERREEFDRLANQDVQKLQQETRLQRVQKIHGKSELDPKWTFHNLVEDAQDVVEAINIAKSFIAAHADASWRNSGAHMMIFYGDYGRGKSHIAGAIAHQLIDQYETTVMYRQLQSLLEMRFSSYDFQSADSAPEKFRQLNKQLQEVDLLILDEVCVNETMLKKTTQSWLGSLLRQRLIDNKNCILITNHNLKDLETALGRYCFESIKEYDTYKVRFQGPSRRKQVVPDYAEPSSGNQYQPNQVR